MKFYLFAKFFQDLSADRLMETCLELGLDGPTLLLRDGYWCRPDELSDIPAFVKTARDHGINVTYADTSFMPGRDKEIEKVYGTLADNGIEKIRLDYIGKKTPCRELPETARRLMENAEALGRKFGVRSIVQIHGDMYPHNATSAYFAIKDLDPKYVGVKMDPGNNIQQEGEEKYWYQAELLGEYIAALGAKSATMVRGEDGRILREFVPAQEGLVDYTEVYRCLLKAGFDGPNILMPFYDSDGGEKRADHLKGEISYLKQCLKEAREEK